MRCTWSLGLCVLLYIASACGGDGHDVAPGDGSGASLCGNGTIDSGEVCDDGNAVTETACPYGTLTCTACDASCSAEMSLTGPYCGDAQTTDGEVCDDGNTVDETACPYGTPTCTGCNASCSSAQPLTGFYCGDGMITEGEICDDGNAVTESACPYGTLTCTACDATCATEISLTGPYCGDSMTTDSEACDDGNTVDETACPYGTPTCTGCNASCSAALPLTGLYCGDGMTTDGEICDDGNSINEVACPYGMQMCTTCSGTCTAPLSLTGPYCGDGVVDTADGETCDDTNTTPGDGCSATCTVESGWGCTGQPSVCAPCTWDPTLQTVNGPLTISISGATVSTLSGISNVWGAVAGSCAQPSLNVTIYVNATNAIQMFGIEKDPFDPNTFPYQSSRGYMFYSLGEKFIGGGASANYGTFWTNAGTTVRLVYASGDLTFYVNGVSQGVAASGLSGSFRPVIDLYAASPGTTITLQDYH